jgi:hypothetical protein
MNWITLLLRALQLVPVIVVGIEHIHAEASGATKKQMAMDALALASGSAGILDPGDQPAIDVATQLTSNVIDNTVAVFNAAGIFGPRGSAPATIKPLAATAAVAASPALVPAVSRLQVDNDPKVASAGQSPAPNAVAAVRVGD